jgi:uncharacterized protein
VFTPFEFLIIGLAAAAAGLINAIAGGGTLISFPALVFAGVPPVSANVTNTVALSPGYLSATFAQWGDMKGQKHRLWMLAPAAVAGGFVGAMLLLQTSEKVFTALIPWLILLAAGLLAIQDRVRGWIVARREHSGNRHPREWLAIFPVFLAAIYGGYFGAGLSVILLAVLGLTLDDNLTRLNALKQGVAFAANITAAIFFLFSGEVVWAAAIVMAVGAILGGMLGGRFAGAIKPATLRRVVITVAVVVAIVYFLR